jgi:hypothetical protein
MSITIHFHERDGRRVPTRVLRHESLERCLTDLKSLAHIKERGSGNAARPDEQAYGALLRCGKKEK